MGNGLMWFGTFHHSEWIDCPQVGSDLSPRSWGTGGTFLSGGGFEVSAPDAHREFSLSWSAASSIPAVARMQAYRDGAYSKTPGDLFYFHDPLSYAVNILPKRWAQPSLMVRTKRPWATAEVSGPGVRGLPLTGAHIVAGTTEPTAPGPGILWIPIPEGLTLEIAVNQVAATGSGVHFRHVRNDGALSSAVSFSGDTIRFAQNSGASVDPRGFLLYFKGEFDVFGIRATLRKTSDPKYTDFQDISWAWHSGMGHSGCRFSGVPTYVPTNGVNSGMASYSAMLREVGDWLQ